MKLWDILFRDMEKNKIDFFSFTKYRLEKVNSNKSKIKHFDFNLLIIYYTLYHDDVESKFFFFYWKKYFKMFKIIISLLFYFIYIYILFQLA